MIKYIIIIVSLFNGLAFIAQEQTAIYGSLWTNNQEMTCNWYVQKNHIVMELISNDEDKTNMRFHFKSSNDEMVVITKKKDKTITNRIHKDSIFGNFTALNFTKNGIDKEFESIGLCHRYQAKSTQYEALAFSLEINQLNLNIIQSFFKSDPILAWFSKNNEKEFPIQYILSKSNGDLLLSYLTRSISQDFDTSVFSH